MAASLMGADPGLPRAIGSVPPWPPPYGPELPPRGVRPVQRAAALRPRAAARARVGPDQPAAYATR